MESVSEVSPLLSKSKQSRNYRKCCSTRVKYRLPAITEKGAIVLIVCNVLAVVAIFVQMQKNSFSSSLFLAFAVLTIIIFPIAGILADTFVGRFKVIQVSIALLLITSLFNTVLLFLHDYIPTMEETVIAMFSEGLCCIAASCYVACILPFTADQLIGASGEQLSFALYWIMWGFVIANHAKLLKCVPSDYFDITAQSVSSSSAIVMAFIFFYWKNSLDTVPQLSNPYKLIFKVLNYARKHKYPQRRSALTYWEEGIPSRIDLGKLKYGGPFAFEEVEDVKTVFRLIPIIVFAGGINVGLTTDWYKLLIELDQFENSRTFLAYIGMFQIVMVAVGIPLYHFLIYPFFYNYIPKMLNRIGFGLFLVFSSYGISAMIGDILLCSSQSNSTCLLFHSELFNISSNGALWIALPNTVYNLGFLLSWITLFEFVFAQTPCSLRGLMAGFTIFSMAASAFIGYAVCQIVSVILPNMHNWFYTNVCNTVTIIVYFVLFVVTSKRYKLRERNDIVPYHVFAEDFFEKELEGQKWLDNQRAQWVENFDV